MLRRRTCPLTLHYSMGQNILISGQWKVINGRSVCLNRDGFGGYL